MSQDNAIMPDLPTDNASIELPSNTLVQCPEKAFSFRYIRHCASCQHFRGLVHATERGEPIKSDDVGAYQVICARPMTRRLSRIEDD